MKSKKNNSQQLSRFADRTVLAGQMRFILCKHEAGSPGNTPPDPGQLNYRVL